MNEFFNFHDTWILIEQNWVYLAVAFGIGAFVGFRTCAPTHKTN